VKPLLEVSNLKVRFVTEGGIARAVDGVDFSVDAGKTLGVVGESGCGKSVTSRAIMGLVEMPGWIESGQIQFQSKDGLVDLAALPPRGQRMRGIRGSEIAMIFQEPMTALNPVLTIGDQIIEAMLVHETIDRRAARERAIAGLAAVRMPLPHMRADEYPHQLSGGMRQRAMIAMALVNAPSLLIADEPTTALDVTIQAQVLDLMNDLRREFSGAIMFITHDLGVIAAMADHVAVMYRGRVVECAPVRSIFKNPLHPYTQGLLRSVPSLTARRGARLQTIEGSVPRATYRERGCSFATRCSQVMPMCKDAVPASIAVASGHSAACFLHHSSVAVVSDA